MKVIWLIIAILLSQPAFAQTEVGGTTTVNPPRNSTPTDKDIPKKPTAPPSLQKKIPANAYACLRQISYQGKILNCDSNQAWDGEGLRTIISESPTAIDQLNAYQRNRRNIQKLAYVGSAGLGLAAIGLLVRRLSDSSQAIAVRNVAGIIGFSTAAFSFSYGLIRLRDNEKHLLSAISIHNQEHADRQIEVNFTTSLSLW